MGDMISVPNAFGYSLLGFAIVFIVLVVLIGMMKLIQLSGGGKRAPQPAAPSMAAVPTVSPVSATVNTAGRVPAKGSLGEVNLFEVDDRTAAMLMAVVADKIGAPLNELRFLNIREIEAGKDN